MPSRGRAVRFVREHGQRRLQSVGQIAGLRDRATDRDLAVLEQRVQVVDERLDFGRVRPVELPLPAFANQREAGANRLKRRDASPEEREPDDETENGRGRHRRNVRKCAAVV